MKTSMTVQNGQMTIQKSLTIGFGISGAILLVLACVS